MALLQIKSHGTVTTHKMRSMKIAYDSMNQTVAAAMQDGYTRVGSAPGITMMICAEHNGSRLPADADFCYIVAVDSGRAK